MAEIADERRQRGWFREPEEKNETESTAARIDEVRSAYAEAYEAGDLIVARSHLAALRTLDPFDQHPQSTSLSFPS